MSNFVVLNSIVWFGATLALLVGEPLGWVEKKLERLHSSKPKPKLSVKTNVFKELPIGQKSIF